MNRDRTVMYLKQNILYAVMLLFILFSSACKKSTIENPQPEEPQTGDDATVNHWVTENMRVYYYWNDGIPNDQSLNFEQNPKSFFETLRNREDRFSWIDKVDDLKDGLSGISTSTGINIGLVAGANDAVFGYIRYVIPGSPAELAGIERGMFIAKVNGSEMTLDNYESILAPYYEGKDLILQLADLVEGMIKPTNEVELTAKLIAEPSVYMHKVLTTNSGRKVGYLFYNRFLNEKSQEVLAAFQDFKNQGVQDLILDVRYNLGGGIAASGLLSALIMPNYDKEKVFVEYNYNQYLNEIFDNQYLADPVNNESRVKKFIDLYPGFSKFPTPNTADSIHNLATPAAINLQRVFVLATYNSASASELVINNLRPYMEVVHIGETTRGKNEGSFTIEDTREPRVIDWAIQPIVLKLANEQHFGDYSDGLKPTIEVDEGYQLKPLGDVEDPLVMAALEKIEPSNLARARVTPPRVKAMFQNIRKFEELHNKARPVLVDGTMNHTLLKRLK